VPLSLGDSFSAAVTVAVDGRPTSSMHARAPQVDGSLGTWAYILSDLNQQREPPALTMDSVYTLLPVVHKYDFTKLLARLVAFVKDKSEDLDSDPEFFTYIVRWLALAERLQLDDLQEVCLDRLRGMTKEQLKTALTVEVEVGRDPEEQLLLAVFVNVQTKLVVREEVKALGQALRDELRAISALAP
jgi:hypothetical protein